MGTILILFILLWFEKGIWHFQFTGGNSPQKKPENVLAPDGRKADTEGGPIVFTYVLFFVHEMYIGLSIYERFFAFLRP